YHTRLISWDPDADGPLGASSIGNQDRSLSADAVIDPPPCSVDGPATACPGTTGHVYSNSAAADPDVIPSGFVYLWSVSGNATIPGATNEATVTVNAGNGCNSPYTVTLTIKTTNDLFITSCQKVVSVADTQAPTLTCPGAITVACASNVPAANTALVTGVSDNCGGTVTVTHEGDNISNQTCANRYTITRTYKATDACGNSATCTQTIIVNDQAAPSLTCPANVTVSCASEVPAVNINDVTGVSDNCSGTVSVTFVSDVISNQTCANRYRITRTYRATDVCGNSATCTQIIVVNDQTPPLLTCPGPVTVSCASAVPSPDPNTVTGVSDNCAGTVSVTFVGDQISNQTCPNRYTITRTYRATDVCGNSATCTQTIIVNDNSAPSLTCPANVTVACASQVPAANPGSVTGVSDNCSGTVTVTHEGDVTSNQTCANRFTITRTYKATDACGNSATCTQLIIVNDQVPPQLTCPGPVTVSCASAVPTPNIGSVTGVSDNCSGTVSVTFVGDVISNQTCANRYTITRTYRATDVCGNSATCTQTITVNDQTAPVITCPSDKIVECSASTAATAQGTGIATATDNCGTVSVTYEDVNSSNGCQSTITRTWTAVDLCGNSSTCTQIIIVRDRTAPQITCLEGGTVTATDNCSDPEDITLILNNGIWTAIDESGNISTCEQDQSRTVVARNTELTNTAVSATKPSVLAFPNPFREQVRFVINTPKAVTGSLDIFNLMGQKIKSVYQGLIPAGTRTFDLNLPGQQFSTLIYVFRTGEEQISGKLLQIADTRNNEP
ncbi:MAG TPA: hypothetical protein VFX58_15305, partial [Chitinophagaceae bacterium]|nr:hypothetical protein [Chitinophagaceae bacterium]